MRRRKIFTLNMKHETVNIVHCLLFIVYCLLVIGSSSLCISCGNKGSMSPEELQHKLDSIKTLEVREKLEAQGINLEDSDNPVKQFFDSLDIQPRPISYSEDYVRYLPDFKPVPDEIVSYLDFEGHHPKAVALPESLGARMILLAADETNEKGRYSIYLYSLDDEYLPVDKLCLYAIEDMEDRLDINPEELIQYFSITSDYEIHLIDFSKKANKTRTEEVYYLDPARQFVLQKSELND